ncbi:MAG: CHAP domain-containing protein, partial [Clostridia bacterium]|nr:CHAP domain-containing protein [Clostridia bacterium]
MKDPLKPRDKITQKMSRDGLIEVNETKETAERISKREQEADYTKQPEQAAQDAAQQIHPAAPEAAPLSSPGIAPKPDTGKTERVMEHISAAQTRQASKKAVRRAQQEATASGRSSRLQFTEEELNTPELEKYIKKSDKAADRLDAARAAIPKEKVLVKERTFDEATGKGKTRLRFEEREKPMYGGKQHKNPLSRPAQEAGLLIHNKIHEVEKDNSGVEGAHKTEEAAERGARYGARKVREGYRSHKLKPYRAAAQAEKAAAKANVEFQYQKLLHDNPQLAASNPVSRYWQKQQIKKQYAKAARTGGAKTAKTATENTRKAAQKSAEAAKKTAEFTAKHWKGILIAIAALLLFIMIA